MFEDYGCLYNISGIILFVIALVGAKKKCFIMKQKGH